MKENKDEWFYVSDADQIDSPALLIYRDRVKENISRAVTFAGNAKKLRPHVKTNKIAEVNRMMMEAGIDKFKCATIAEAEMLGSVGATDVLIAYPVNGPKADRLIKLIRKYPATNYFCLVDNISVAEFLSEKASDHQLIINVYIDLNIGMNRTGVVAEQAFDLYKAIKNLKGIAVKGLHAYDGHIHDTDVNERQKKSDAAFSKVEALKNKLAKEYGFTPNIVIGGSPSFTMHLKRNDVECSPGTFVFWDHGYKKNVTEQPFDYAALLMTRVISVLDEHTICTDLGYKSVASENPLPRVHFFNVPGAEQLSQSEEHLVLKVPDATQYNPGDVLYAAPMHICPTVALYERASVIADNKIVGEWKVIARDRKITI